MRSKKAQRILMDKHEAMINRVFHNEKCSQRDYIELQTFCAVAIEVMRKCDPALLAEAATTVEARGLTREMR